MERKKIGKLFSLQEKAEIIAFYECGLSFHELAEKNSRHCKTVANFIKNN